MADRAALALPSLAELGARAGWSASGPPWHLGLGAGETHAGALADCARCAEYRREHPEAKVPTGDER